MKNGVRFLGGVIALLIGLSTVNNIMISKVGSDVLYTFRYEQQDSLDVLFVGASSCYRFYSSPELWHDYGIASYNLGTSEQSLSQSYYVLKYALETQEPKLVVVELNTGLRLVEPYTTTRVHQVMDNLKKNSVWFEMLNVYADESDEIEFLLPLTLYHTRWKELTESDFLKNKNSNKGISYNLNTEEFNIFQKAPDDYYEVVDEEVYNYLFLIEDLCEKKNTRLLFVFSPVPCVSYGEELDEMQGWINTLCKDKEFEEHFLNLCDYIDETGINFSNDYSDYLHVNIAGALKITKFLGEYLIEHYELPDRRVDRAYDEWNISYDNYCEEWNRKMDQANIPNEDRECYQEVFFSNK